MIGDSEKQLTKTPEALQAPTAFKQAKKTVNGKAQGCCRFINPYDLCFLDFTLYICDDSCVIDAFLYIVMLSVYLDVKYLCTEVVRAEII